MTGFRKKFFDSLLKEADIPPVEGVPGEDTSDASDEEAFNQGLDSDTPPEAFDDVPANPEISIRQQQTAQTTATLQEWISEVENFISFLNGLDEGSMNYKLNQSDCDSIMADVRRSETKKISRLAQDLSSLGEALKQYLLGAERKAEDSGSI
jgi:hypothetical protein